MAESHRKSGQIKVARRNIPLPLLHGSQHSAVIWDLGISSFGPFRIDLVKFELNEGILGSLITREHLLEPKEPSI